MGERPWTATADGVVVTVRLTALKIRVRAAPTGGEANASLRQLLADRLGVAASRIDVVAGASARIKRVRIVGNTAALTAAFGRLVGAA
jgi:uncharacterized protein